MKNKEYKCKKCKDTGIVKFKPITEMTDYQWVKWETRPCDCLKEKSCQVQQ